MGEPRSRKRMRDKDEVSFCLWMDRDDKKIMKRRARSEGLSMTDYINRLIEYDQEGRLFELIRKVETAASNAVEQAKSNAFEREISNVSIDHDVSEPEPEVEPVKSEEDMIEDVVSEPIPDSVAVDDTDLLDMFEEDEEFFKEMEAEL